MKVNDEGIFNSNNIITIGGHGSHGYLHDERLNINYRQDSARMDIKDLVIDIKNTNKWQNSNNGKNISYIHLYSCYSGLGYGNDDKNSVAQKLANELNIPVIGYSGKYMFFPYIPITNGPKSDSKKKLFLPKKERSESN